MKKNFVFIAAAYGLLQAASSRELYVHADTPGRRNVLPAQIEGDLLQSPTPHLPEAVKNQNAGKTLSGSYKICVQEEGAVVSVSTVSGIEGADAAIHRTLETWRYKGQKGTVCYIKNLTFVVEGPKAPLVPSGPSFLSPETFELPNGLRVILAFDRRLPLVAAHLSYQVGSSGEGPGKSGMAHLAEHLFFEDTPGNYLFNLGANQINATTTFDSTNDYLVVPTNNLPGALAVLSRHLWLVTDRTRFPDLSSERNIVQNERHQRISTVPFRSAEETVWHALFPVDHPYHGFVIGTKQDIEQARISDVRAYCMRNYGPSTAVLTLVGDFQPERAKSLVKQYFGDLPKGPDRDRAGPSPTLSPVALDREVRINFKEPVAQHSRLFVAWHTPPAFAALDAAGEVVARLLVSGRAGILRKQLKVDQSQGMAITVAAQQQNLRLQSVFEITVDAPPRADLQAILAEVDATVQSLATLKIEDDVLGPIKASLRIHTLSQADNYLQRAQLLQHYQLHLGEADGLRKDLLRYEAVTEAQIHEFVRTYLRPTARVVLFAQAAGQGGEK